MVKVVWIILAITAIIGLSALWHVRPIDGCGWGERRIWQGTQGVAPAPGDPPAPLTNFCHSRFTEPPPPPPSPPTGASPPPSPHVTTPVSR
jgi:hypothetical protein